jgi:peptide/nickel transport system substrate-binding protein
MMNNLKLKCALSTITLLLLGVSAPVYAAAGDECTKIVGYEWSGEKQSMDPADMSSGDDAYHIFSVYDRLLGVSSNFELLPELAKSWSSSEDGKVWTFQLRERVKFHDGSDFDAADVVYTFQRILDPETASGGAPLLSFLKPDGIVAIDAHTVEFRTEESVVELPLLITNKFTNIVPAGADRENLRLNGVGTGPFSQEMFEPNGPVRILRRNDDWWGGDVKSECLRITVIQEPVASVAAIKSGEVDVLLNVDPATIPAVKDDANVELTTTAASTSMVLAMWSDTPPFDDLRVREALKLVVDRDTMVNTVLLGFGEVANDNPVPLGSPDAFTGIAPVRDIEKAKQLLAEAGYADGLEIDLYTGEGVPGMVNMAQVYAQMAAEAGITVNVNVTPAESYWDDVWLKYSFVTSAWSMRAPATGLSIAYTQDAKWNETHWYRDDYDGYLVQASTTADNTARADLYRNAQRLMAEEGGVIIPMFIHQVAAMRKGCSGFVPHVNNQYLDFENIECK